MDKHYSLELCFSIEEKPEPRRSSGPVSAIVRRIVTEGCSSHGQMQQSCLFSHMMWLIPRPSRGDKRCSGKNLVRATWTTPRGRVFPKSRHSTTCDPLDTQRCTPGSPNGYTRQGDGWGLSHTRIRGARDIARAPPGGLHLGGRADGVHTTRGPLAHSGLQWGPILGCITDHGRWPCRHVAHVAGLGSSIIGIG